MRVPENADRDFTASCFVVNDNYEILLMNHSKLDFWLRPGGHVEESETPDEAALRETIEETGWKVEIEERFCPDTEFEENSEDLPSPFNINLHRFEVGHWHCDFQFVASPVEKTDASHSHEHDGLRWASKSELKALDMPENCRSSCRKAIDLLRD